MNIYIQIYSNNIQITSKNNFLINIFNKKRNVRNNYYGYWDSIVVITGISCDLLY